MLHDRRSKSLLESSRCSDLADKLTAVRYTGNSNNSGQSEMSADRPTGMVTLTPQQVRQARALLAWSRKDLANAVGFHTSVIAHIETGEAPVAPEHDGVIRTCLGERGIQFSQSGEVSYPDLPAFPHSSRHTTPVRWVTSDDLASWGSQPDGPVNLPTLVSNLIRATHGTAAHVHFPADGGVRHPGWDGQSCVDIGSHYVPSGVAGWELSTQRDGVAAKIRGDYQKRTVDPLSLVPCSATFVAVTLQHWPGKEEWAREQVKSGPWSDVRVYDADDLVHWIEITPAVGLWLATYLGKRPEGTTELEAAWEEWSLSTEWPITKELVLWDRDETAAQVLRWLRGEASVLSLQSTSSEEVVAFIWATLSELPEESALSYRARCLVVNEVAARALKGAAAPLILILTDPNPGLAAALAKNGHFVAQAYDQTAEKNDGVLILERPSREGIAAALILAGVPEDQARSLARDSARNLTVLRRRMPAAAGRNPPQWAEASAPRALLAALLAGGWDEDHQADRDCLAALAGSSYEQFVEGVRPYFSRFDSPLQKIGTSWRVASPSDAWHLLAGSLTSALIDQLGESAIAVLGELDPRFNMDPSERWLARVKGVGSQFSPMLRHGIGRTLILLALYGDRVVLVPDARSRTDTIVSQLLDCADEHRWWSLARDFRLLAEASPTSLLSAIEDSLNDVSQTITVLFDDSETGAFGGEYLSDLMWALEMLAWSPAHMPRVTRILSALAALDVKPRRYQNGPANSLREIHALWNPQTYATLDQRLLALDHIRKRVPESSWNLMLGILPSAHDSLTPSPKPLWRDFSVTQVEVVSLELLRRGAVSISDRLVTDLGEDPERFDSLLGRIKDLRPDPSQFLSALEKAQLNLNDERARSTIWSRLREVLHHHRAFPDAPWRLPESILDRLAQSYEQFTPADLLDRVRWLFQAGAALPNPSTEGWKAEEKQLGAAQASAALAVFESSGIEGVFSLAQVAEIPSTVAFAVYEAGIPEAQIDALLELAIRAEDGRSKDLAISLVRRSFHDRRELWADSLIAKISSEKWGAQCLLTLLIGLPTSSWTWSRVVALGEEIDQLYWRSVPILWIDGDLADIEYAIQRLMDSGRARVALSLVRERPESKVRIGLLTAVLNEVANQSSASGGEGDYGMFQYHVSEAFKRLDRELVDQGIVAALEWRFLGVLEHSARPPVALLRELSSSPHLFIQLISAIFQEVSQGETAEDGAQEEGARARARQAYRLLEMWNRIPGASDNGTLDLDLLEGWLRDARGRAEAMNRLAFADCRIGQVLAASPVGDDGVWPHEAVREVLDNLRSKEMIEGFTVGIYNGRGLTTRQARDGGEQERVLATQYRSWSDAISAEHPYTSRALDQLARSYEEQARHHDDDAASMDWSD